MKRLLLYVLCSLAYSSITLAQSEPAGFKAAVEKFKQFHNAAQPDSLYKMFGGQMAVALTPEMTRQQFGALKAQLGKLNSAGFDGYANSIAVYDAKFEKGRLLMYMELDAKGKIVGLRFAPPAAKPAVAMPTVNDPNMDETPMLVKVSAGSISGSLGLPKNLTGKIPVVLIIAGSGPTDRNGPANVYQKLASALAKQGIASLRYDKRGVGQSSLTIKEADMRFEDYSDDARELIKTLVADARFNKVVVMGHSEGSLVGIIAAEEQPVKGLISLAGAGDRIDKILNEQLKSQPQVIRDEARTIMDSLVKGKTVDRVDPQLYALYRPSLQPYMISWMKHDPAKEIKKLKMPVLIVQGTTDIQVSIADAERLKKAKSDAKLMLIQGMNHVFRNSPAEREANIATYSNADLPVMEELISGIVNFVKSLK